VVFVTRGIGLLQLRVSGGFCHSSLQEPRFAQKKDICCMRGRCSGSHFQTGSGYTGREASVRANRGTQQTGNANEPAVIKFSVPYTGDFDF